MPDPDADEDASATVDESRFRALAADGVILDDGRVLLLERNHPPFEGTWVLPGGMVESDETAAEACTREVSEEVGVDASTEEFVGLYDDPNRDPRGNVSAAFRCEPREPDDFTPEAREEAAAVAWFGVDDLPEMGFDHAQIVQDAVFEG